MAAPASAAGGYFDWGMSLPARGAGRLVHVVIDTPKGSSNKYQVRSRPPALQTEPDSPRGLHFPCDFGFIPSTAAADGDALDVALFAELSELPGMPHDGASDRRPAGRADGKGRVIRNDRLIAVPVTPVNNPQVRDLKDLPKRFIEQVEQFFMGYNRAQGRRFVPCGRRGKRTAEQLLNAAMRLYGRRHGESHGRRTTVH